ncbi:hypothetical protein GCM10027535_28880 [Mycolicibacterium hippocampi]|uniref:Secreted protein n=2 Tax=Mycolicibacterium hippocampi TaxID=659824 RepID=A0A7I9ZR39_9MYCO|nr:hypothetical protein MHIP_38120 [Mycolicibacterium hippocampi]
MVMPALPKAAVAVGAAVIAAATLGGPSAQATPPSFPDVGAYPPIDLGDYRVQGAHPSTSGWAFRTPSGLRCQLSLIAELGVFCQGPLPGAQAELDMVSVSLTRPAQFGRSGTEVGDAIYPLLPTGTKIAPDNGVVCAVPSDDALACRAEKPASWPSDTPDPPDRRYGEHGFVVSPSGTQAF